MWLAPIVLEGHVVRLEPLTAAHAAALWAVSTNPALFRYMPQVPRSEDDLRAYIAAADEALAASQGLAFATIARDTGRPVGSTSYLAADRRHRRLEIGGTWVTAAYQRTAVNTEALLLLLRHAFETLGCRRVEFKTDRLNERSRRALERLGAIEEGVFRNHMLLPDGRSRDSVYYAIIDSEWPAVRDRLTGLLTRRTPA